MNHHLDEQQVNDCADNVLDAGQSRVVEAHLQDCAACSERLASLRQLKAQLASLPRDIAPPAHVLAGVHAHIAEPSVVDAAGSSARKQPPAGTVASAVWRVRPRLLAAAAVILVAASSAVTARVLRVSPDRAPPAIATDTGPPAGARLVSSSALEQTYEHAVAELERTFVREQSMLTPETRRVLELNLAIIDRALAESRAALAADPANAALADVIRSGYERKLDVLRSATTQARARS